MSRDMLQRHPILRLLLYLVTLIAVLYAGGLVWAVIARFSTIITLFFLAWIIAFVLRPLSTYLERHRVPRPLAIVLIYLALLALAAGSIVLAIPAIHTQVTQLASQATATFTEANLHHLTDMAVGYLQRLGLSPGDARALVSQLADRIPSVTSSLASSAVSTTTSLLSTAETLLLDTTLIIILSFYIMLDGDRLVEEWITKLPPAWIADVRHFQSHVDTIFGGFLRAQLIIAAVYGVLTYVVLLIVGRPDGLVYALLATIAMVIPFIGPFLAIVPPVVAVFLQSSPNHLVGNLVIVVVGLIIAQQITLQVIAPRVMSAHVGLPPLLLFAALLVGAQEAGIWGAIFAGPIAAVIVAMLDTFFERFQQISPLYPHIPRSTRTAPESEGALGRTDQRAIRAGEPASDPAPARAAAADTDGAAVPDTRDSDPMAPDDGTTLLDRLLRR